MHAEGARVTDRELTYVVAAQTDIGTVRKVNEDCWRTEKTREHTQLVIVADGIGGGPGGGTASRIAVNLLAERVYEWPRDCTAEDATKALRSTLREIHQMLADRGSKDKELRGMGTTIVCALLLPGFVTHAYAGDSALFWFRRGRCLYQTEPHRSGGKLISCLGGPFSIYDFKVGPTKGGCLEVQPDDLLLLCSDGLVNALSFEKILQFMAVLNPAPAALAEKLVTAAVKRGGKDNITAVVVHVLPAPI